MITTTTEKGFREHGSVASGNRGFMASANRSGDNMSAPAPVTEIHWRGLVPIHTFAKIAKLPRGIVERVLAEPTPHESQTELFRDASWLHRAGLNEPERREFLKVKFASYYRDITEREFDRALERSKGQDLSTGPKYPPKNTRTLGKVLAENIGDVANLKTLSPTPDPGGIASGDVIDQLFPSAGLLCLAASLSSARTEARSEFVGVEQAHQFMVPNKMNSRLGMSQDQRMSPRTNNNVGRQEYQVIEFDSGTLDEQARIHLHLKSLGVPLVMVVFSGGKSLHGWYRVGQLGGEKFCKFLCYSAALGADRATFVPCQLVRTPNAIRDGGAKQEVLYFNPRAGL